MSEDLKPCPFCGAEAEVIDIEEGENAGGSCVCCTRCQASSNVEFGFKENFVSNWDRRAEITRLTQERDAARAEVLEEAARVADKHYQDSKKDAAYYKSLPDDDGSYGQCLADMIVAGDIAARIRSLLPK